MGMSKCAENRIQNVPILALKHTWNDSVPGYHCSTRGHSYTVKELIIDLLSDSHPGKGWTLLHGGKEQDGAPLTDDVSSPIYHS